MTVDKSVLHIFEPNTKAEASKVNDNFEFLKNDLEKVEIALEESIEDIASTTKEDLRSEIEVVKDGSAEIDLSNVESSILTNALMPDYSSGTERTIATEYIAETDLYLTVSDNTPHDDYYYKLFISYKETNIQFSWGGWSDEPDKQRDFVGLNIPKDAKFKVAGYSRTDKESNANIHGTIKTFPFIGIGG